jgi:hypothetical protein
MDVAGRRIALGMLAKRIERHPSKKEKAGLAAGREGIPSINAGEAHGSLQR